MDLGKRVQELRRGQGLSQEALAERLGVTRQAVSKWETDESLPDVCRLAQLSELFGVSTDYLIKGVPPETETAAETGSPKDAGAFPPAADSAQYPAAPCCPRIPCLAQMVTGWTLAGLGAFGILTIWVLSTMIVTYRQVEQQTGQNTYEVWDVAEYSFGGFVSQYNLQALLGVCAALLLAGAILLLRRWYQLRRTHGDS